MSAGTALYPAFSFISIYVLKLVNENVQEPYMDEPFHVPQAQAYCEGKWSTWDPKLTTPPGLYIISVLLKKLFLVKCNLSMLRLTPLVALLALPPALTRLLCFHQRERPPPLLSPSMDAVVLAAFPIVWFFGFLYYTELPSLFFVVCTIAAAGQGKHWLAGLLGLLSCAFRQTNIIWTLYAFAASQLMYQRWHRVPKHETAPSRLHDPPALAASPIDFRQTILSIPAALPQLIWPFIPYGFVLMSFAGFVFWNGGIVLGDKSNHIPTLHVPQLYYFISFATLMGWPVLLSVPEGPLALGKSVYARMFGSTWATLKTIGVSAIMAKTVQLFTIHHPFLLSDNRHYTFYVWRRVFMLHPIMPYILVPGYLACAWAWFLRAGREQTMLQTLLLPACLLPTLLPTPLLEPRYFLVPYVLLRSQFPDVPRHWLVVEGMWYALINAATMYVFVFCEREGVGRFMW